MKMNRACTVTLMAAALMAWGCGDEDGQPAGSGGSGGAAGVGGGAGSGGSAGSGGTGPGGFAFVQSEEGSELTLRHPDGTEESIGSDVILGWINGQLLEGAYFKQLRIGTQIGTMDLKLSFPSDTSPTGLIESVHELREVRLPLEETPNLEKVQVELFFQSSDPPFDGLTNASGTVEISLGVNTPLGVYDIAGEIDAHIAGEDGEYGITGYFWARSIDS